MVNNVKILIFNTVNNMILLKQIQFVKNVITVTIYTINKKELYVVKMVIITMKR